MSMFTIQTPFGKKTILRRIGVAFEYYEEAPSASSPHGGWWTHNDQKGFVPVPSNGRALCHARKLAGDPTVTCDCGACREEVR